MAVLATMLARYRRFRHILIFERRGWLDRLVFTLAIAVPLMAGVAFRLLLNYNAADLTLEGAFLAGPDRRPLHRRAGRLSGRRCPRCIAGEFAAIPFAVGCGFAGGGLREACPKEAIWQFSAVRVRGPAEARVEDGAAARDQLAARAAARRGGARAPAPGARRPLRRAPAVLPRLAVDRHDGAGGPRHRARRGDADQDLEQRAHRAPAAGTGNAAHGGEDRGAQEPDQPALPLQHADLDLVAHPHRSPTPRGC